MAKIFLSHAGGDEDLVDEFVSTILASGCGVDRRNEGELYYSSDAETGTQGGANFSSTIQANLADAELVIAILTQRTVDKPWVIAEMGAAWVSVLNHQTRFLPLLVPPMTEERLGGMLKGLEVRQIGRAPSREQTATKKNGDTKLIHAALDEVRRAVLKVISPREGPEDREWSRRKDDWIRFVDERADELLLPDPNSPPMLKLRDAYAAGKLDDKLVERYVERTTFSLSLLDGIVAKSIESQLSVRWADDTPEYWLYNLQTTTAYGTKLGNRQKIWVSVVPDYLSKLDEAKDPDNHPGPSVGGEAWNIVLSPVLNRDDWNHFKDAIAVYVTPSAGESEPTTYKLHPVDPPKDDVQAQHFKERGGLLFGSDAEALLRDWQQIKVEFKNVPHSVAVPAIYFQASDICSGQWTFEAGTPNPDLLDVRAVAITSKRDIFYTQKILEQKRGVRIMLSPHDKSLLFPQDAVLVTLVAVEESEPARQQIEEAEKD